MDRPNGVSSTSRTWPYVLAFAIEMERKLAENAHQDEANGDPGWLAGFHPLDCMHRIYQEVNELRAANLNTFPSCSDETRRDLIREAADVGNFCMMLACIRGNLEPQHGD